MNEIVILGAGLALTELHPGVTLDEVRAKIGCELAVALAS